ncbi:DNA-binding protein [Neocallimastix lanati (nom. inval.)]|nr:DNA-binding protein [Neocallimastix sp. JGI-2020a]
MDNNRSKGSIITENKNQIIDIFCELLEVSTHLILYVTKVYPIDFFDKREKYGTPVVMSRHPQLNGYIRDVILSLKPYLQKDLIENIYILIINDKDKPVKRFVYTVKDLLQKNYDRELNIDEIGKLFNNFIRRIWGAPMDELDENEDLSFQFMVKLKGDGESQSSDNSKFPWILADDDYLTPIQRKEEEQVSGGRYINKGKERMDEDENDDNDEIMYIDENENVPPPKITSIYSVNNPSVKIQLYVED